MYAIGVISVWIHVLAACVWIGGMAFLGLVLVPVLRRPDVKADIADLIHRSGVRFRAIGWICLLLLIATGFVNLYRWGLAPPDLLNSELWTTPFGRVLAAKLGLVVVILAISIAHDFVIGPRATALLRAAPRSEQAQRLRRMASWIGRLNLLLAVVVVGLAVMIVRGNPF